MAHWLTSDELWNGQSSLLVFDLFGLLAEDDPTEPDFNMLRADYRQGRDSHPNRIANKAIDPLLAGFLVETIAGYRTNTTMPDRRASWCG